MVPISPPELPKTSKDPREKPRTCFLEPESKQVNKAHMLISLSIPFLGPLQTGEGFFLVFSSARAQDGIPMLYCTLLLGYRRLQRDMAQRTNCRREPWQHDMAAAVLRPQQGSQLEPCENAMQKCDSGNVKMRSWTHLTHFQHIFDTLFTHFHIFWTHVHIFWTQFHISRGMH